MAVNCPVWECLLTCTTFQEGMEAHVKEDHYSDASFREKYFRPTDYGTNSSSKSTDNSFENVTLNSAEHPKV